MSDTEDPKHLPHLREDGSAHMVNVGLKPDTRRVAEAEAFVRMMPSTVEALRAGNVKKGDALSVARVAGIMGAKKTSDLIPLAHPIALTHVSVDVEVADDGVWVRSRVETFGPTGVEMEALTAASTAALTIYDMAKSIERGMEIMGLRLVMKTGGRSGVFRR